VSRFGTLLMLDVRLLLTRGLFRTVAASCILAALVAVAAAGNQPGGAWWRLAQANRVTVPLLLSFGAILGAVSLSGDAAAGSLRGVLMRPVSRSAIVLSRALVLTAGVAVVHAASMLSALALAAALDDFSVITYGSGDLAVPLISRDELAAAVPSLLALALPSLVCAALIGLMVGATWGDPSSCTIGALLLVLFPYVIETVFGASTPWAFTHGATLGASVFSELAEGVTTRLGVVSSREEIAWAACSPLALGAATIAMACGAFTLRDFRN
jgi:hypothetical protein